MFRNLIQRLRRRPAVPVEHQEALARAQRRALAEQYYGDLDISSVWDDSRYRR